MKKIRSVTMFLFLIAFSGIMSAHCDTMDGPVVADARKALDKKNVNYVLKWVRSEDEAEIRNAFDLSVRVRGLNADATQLSEKYFFETVVRLHRQGEGMEYTGIKPSGTPVDEKIKAADKAIETGNISPLGKLVPPERMAELTERFEKVMILKNFNVDDVAAGRKYIESYVQFFHFAEGEEEHHDETHANH